MKIKSITPVGKKEVYDITVEGNAQYALKNGAVVSNTGIYYSADTIWIVGRQQDKDGTEIQGYHFIITIEKSRFVKEKSKLPVSVSWKGGIQKWSGLLDVAVDAGYVIKPKAGWYVAVDPTIYEPEVKEKGKVTKEMVGALTKAMREAQTMTKDFWETVFSKTDFARFISDKFSVAHVSMIDESIPDDISIDDIEETDSPSILDEAA